MVAIAGKIVEDLVSAALFTKLLLQGNADLVSLAGADELQIDLIARRPVTGPPKVVRAWKLCAEIPRAPLVCAAQLNIL